MISEITNLDSCKWNKFIYSNIDSNIFHTPNWLKVLNEVYGYNVSILCSVDIEGNIKAGIPIVKIKNKIVSLPFSDYLPELKFEDLNLQEIHNYIINIYKDNNLISFESKNKILDNRYTNIGNSVIHFGYYNTSFSDIEKSFIYNHKWGVKKAKKDGLRIQLYNNLEGIKLYYDLHVITRKRQGTPVQSFKFFISIMENIISKGNGIICIVYKEHLPISGGVFFFFNKTFTHKYGASDSRFWKSQPNNLMFYEMIKYAIENDFTIFDFGKTDLKNEGLRKFKSGWGAVEKPLYYSYYPVYRPNKLFKFATDKIVKPLIQFSPKFVCRGIGEVFYKYTA